VNELIKGLEKEGGQYDCKIELFERTKICSGRPQEIGEQFNYFVSRDVRLVLCILLDQELYGVVKFEGDRIGLPSQCLTWKKLERMPRGFVASLLLKMRHSSLFGNL
jgi:hypothetical protein